MTPFTIFVAGTTGYDFLLTTLLVVDEFGSGLPCAYLLSNRADTAIMNLFFTAVREAVGVISANVFMSDDAPEFFNAWSAVMGPAEKQLLCTWHVDKNWRLNIKKLVEGQELKASVYKAVRVLLECPDHEDFATLLKAFLETKDPALQRFLAYFKSHYANRPKVWAFCFRRGAGINTNMYLEAMHKTLKHCYLEGKKNKRVDKLISALMEMTYNKLFERLVQLCKGKTTTRIAQINKSHLAALKIDDKDVLHSAEDVWDVKSQSTNGVLYKVARVKEQGCEGCHLRCEVCKTCIHDYTCTCHDHVARFTLCKHIHAVTLSVSRATHESLPPTDRCEVISAAVDDPEQMLESIKDLQAARSLPELSETKEAIATALSVIGDLTAGGFSDETVHSVNQLILAAAKLLKDSKDRMKNFSGATQEPANKRADKQKRFFHSTKKARLSAPEVSLAKPTVLQKEAITQQLLDNNLEDIHIHSTFDHVY